MKLRDERRVLFPVLAAAYPVLALAAGNAEMGFSLGNLLVAVLVQAIVAVLAWLVSGMLSGDADRRLVIAFLGVVWFSSFGFLAGALGGSPLDRPLRSLSLHSGPFLIGIVFALWYRGSLARLSRVLRLATVFLLFFPLTSLLFSATRTAAAPSAGGELSRSPLPPGEAPPDIYLIVLDKYTGSRSLRANYGFDNSGFEARLRERGFFVPRNTSSNYVHTLHSLSSMLNWSYLDELLPGIDPEQNSLLPLLHLIENNRTWRFLKDRGYEFVFFPSSFPATRENRFADRVLPRPIQSRERLNVAAAWLANTPLVLLARGRCQPASRCSEFPYRIESAGEIEEKFETAAGLGSEPGPRFVFMHLLVPHEPYIFRADCSHREPFWPPTDIGAEEPLLRDAYLQQIACVNRMVERLVDRLIGTSSRPPIILLQGDHGHGRMIVDVLGARHLALDEIPGEKLDERLDAFAAYHLPGGGEALMTDSITPVNVIPAILNHYFDARIPLRENRAYWVDLQRLYRFVRVR